MVKEILVKTSQWRLQARPHRTEPTKWGLFWVVVGTNDGLAVKNANCAPFYQTAELATRAAVLWGYEKKINVVATPLECILTPLTP